MSETEQAGNTKGNVLLVDDDKFLLDMYAMKFTHEGYIVHGCLSVTDAIDVLTKGFKADVVLLDLVMPERDGFALLVALRDQKLVPDALKIALTNQSDEKDQNHAKELGADLCFVKATMIPSEVVNMVESEIMKRRRQ